MWMIYLDRYLVICLVHPLDHTKSLAERAEQYALSRKHVTQAADMLALVIGRLFVVVVHLNTAGLLAWPTETWESAPLSHTGCLKIQVHWKGLEMKDPLARLWERIGQATVDCLESLQEVELQRKMETAQTWRAMMLLGPMNPMNPISDASVRKL